MEQAIFRLRITYIVTSSEYGWDKGLKERRSALKSEDGPEFEENRDPYALYSTKP